MASEVGEAGEDGDGAALPGATDEPTTVLSVSAQESQEKEDLSSLPIIPAYTVEELQTLLGPFIQLLPNVSLKGQVKSSAQIYSSDK